MKKTILSLAKGALFLIMWLFPLCMFAQNVTVNGIVTDTKKEPLFGVTVQVRGTTTGTTTDIDGKFTLLNVPPDAVLEISYVGMLPQTIELQGRTSLQVVMAEDTELLDEVVVVGYGTMKKSDLTGALSQVSGEDLKNLPVRSVADALQGKTAGVTITSTGGSPGTPPTVRIRGVGTVNNNNPLYIVDGLPQTDIGWLNPNNIASMEILKDASATAIYGSRAANGVIIISTIRGSGKESETRVTFDAYYGVQNPVKVYEVMNASEFIDYKNLANMNAGNPPFYTDSQKSQILQFLKENTGSEKGTDWWKEINHKNAPVQNYDVSISGSSDKLAYHTNLGYMAQDGIIKGSDFDRISWLTNIDHELYKWLKMSGNIAVIKQSRRNVIESSPGFNTSFIAFTADPISPVYRRDLKNIPDFLESGFFMDQIDPNDRYSWYSPILLTNKENPVAQTDIRKDNVWNDIALKGGLSFDADITSWLKFRTNIGIDLYRGGSDGFSPKYYLDGDQFNNDATVSKHYSNSDYWVWENTLTFNKTFGDHNLLAMVGTSAEETMSEATTASRQGLVSNSEDQRILDAASKNPAASGWESESALQSLFTRIFYSYKNRYLFTANIRRDGSSNFGPGHKWGTFPSFSAGWNFSEEDFLSDTKYLSNGKLRVSWGQIGNQAIGGGAYQSAYTGNWGYYLFGSNFNTQLMGGNNLMGNPSVEWETTEQFDIGVDLGFFKNTLSLNIDYFQKKTKDMLLQVPLPSYLGFPNNPWVNAGSIVNKGWEIDLKYRNSIEDFNYSVGANLFTFKNKVLSLGGGEPLYGGGWITVTTTKTEIGKPIGYFYGLKTDGIFQSEEEVNAYKNKEGELIQPTARPGDLRFLDLNGDGVINANDRTNIGNPFPKASFGFNFAADYKGFDLQLLFQGTYGNKIMNAKKIDMYSGVGWYNAPKDLMKKAWSPTNPTNKQFQINADNTNNLQVSDWLVEDGSYVRLKNIQLGYSLPQNILTHYNISNVRIWVGAYNLLTFTKYSGLDPEIGNTNPLNNGVDDGYYPQSATYMMGVNMTF